ncbi:MAG: glucose-1-phosphate adenylyltransferase [Gemmataceae bacterium]
MQDVLCLILAGGRGTRFYPLTKLRSEPAVPIAGNYRLIDIPISNCLNSGLNRVYVLTQFLSVSLHGHIARTYKCDPFSQGFVEVLAAQQTYEAADWYQGTADAVRQNLRYITSSKAKQVLILFGDQLYRMNFAALLRTHQERQADVTLAVVPVTAEQAARLGLVRLDDQQRIVAFVEKPQTEAQAADFQLPAGWLERQGLAHQGRSFLASMGIYLFNRETLLDMVNTPPLAVDFATQVFPRGVNTYRFQAHLFDGYWQDVGTIRSYYETSLALVGDHPPFDFTRPDHIIYTRKRYLPPSRISASQLDRCLISDGCVVLPHTTLQRCILGVRSRIGRGVTLRDSILIGTSRIETDADRAANRTRGLPDFTIGDGSVITGAIIDRDCRIGRDVRIVNQRNLQEGQGDNYVIREGIVVIPKGTTVPDGTVI